MDLPNPGIETGSPALHAGSLPTEISGEAQEIGVGGGGHGLAWFQSLGWEDPLEEGMATHSRILAWRIPWTEDPGGLQSMGSQRVGYD